LSLISLRFSSPGPASLAAARQRLTGGQPATHSRAVPLILTHYGAIARLQASLATDYSFCIVNTDYSRTAPIDRIPASEYHKHIRPLDHRTVHRRWQARQVWTAARLAVILEVTIWIALFHVRWGRWSEG